LALLDGIVDRGSPVMANRDYALFKQLFDFGAAMRDQEGRGSIVRRGTRAEAPALLRSGVR
jgi:hypothetical protein